MVMITQPRRPVRSGEWTTGAAIMFNVALAATRSVTLAARSAGMSRKAAYALRKRDPLFAASWQTAKKEAVRPPEEWTEGDTVDLATPSISSTSERRHTPRAANPGRIPAWRNHLISELRLARESTQARALAALARRAPAQ